MKPAHSGILVSFLTIWMGSMTLAAPDSSTVARDEPAVQVAKAWFSSLQQGDTAVVAALSDCPFNLDGKRDILTMGELTKVFDQIADKPVPQGAEKERISKMISARVERVTPEQILVAIRLEGDDDTVSVFIKPGDVFRVVGFRD